MQSQHRPPAFFSNCNSSSLCITGAEVPVAADEGVVKSIGVSPLKECVKHEMRAMKHGSKKLIHICKEKAGTK